MKVPIDGGVIVITGASSGIGTELARQLAARARCLVLVARRVERLEDLKKELLKDHPLLEVFVEPCDLSDRTATEGLLKRITDLERPVDVLINNAGVGVIGVFDKTDLKRQMDMIELNVSSVVVLTHHLVRGMVERGSGGVLNVSSGFGLSFLPGFASYVGTKHFVTGFTEALRAELSGTGVAITQVCPGPVKTEFDERAGNFTGKQVPSFIEISAAHCARVAIRALERDRALVIPGLLMWVVMGLGAWTPRFVLRLLIGPIGRALRKKQVETMNEAPRVNQ